MYFGMSSDWPNRYRVVIKPQGPPISIKVSLDPLSMHYAGDLLVVTLCATDLDDANVPEASRNKAQTRV